MSTFSKSVRHIKRSPYQAMAAILIMTFTFIIGGLFFLAGYASQQALTYFESKPQLIIFFSDDTTKNTIEAVGQELKNSGKVADTHYVSKDDALKLYTQWYRSDPLLLEMVTADILPQSLEVSAKDAKYLKELADMVKGKEGVEDLEYQADVVEQLVKWTTMIRIIGIGLVGFLTLESVLVMVTVIGMKIALRKDEISLLQLIGATNWYIGKPFVVEGLLYGVIGAIIGWIVSLGGSLLAYTWLQTLLAGVPLGIYHPLFLLVYFIGIVISGGLLGALGAFGAVSRYLR